MKNVFKAIGFCSILLVILVGLSKFLATQKTAWNVKIEAAGIAREKDNTIDYIVLGDSETYTSIVPLEIWNDYGYTGYILGTSAQRLSESKDILLSSLKNQKPKLVILETNAVFRKIKPRQTNDSIFNTVNDLYRFHDNWKYFVNPFYRKFSGNEKGYIYSTRVRKVKQLKEKVKTNKKTSIPEENVGYIKDMIKICKENNMTFILVTTPSIKNWSYKRHNSLVALAKKNKITYIDLNMDENLKMNWTTDTQDEGDHLNYYGAYKTTKALEPYLANLNVLEDHREDSYYSEWHDSYKKYRLKFNTE